MSLAFAVSECLVMKDHGVGSVLQELSGPTRLGGEGLEPRPLSGALSFTDEAVSILTSNSQLARTLLGRGSALKRAEGSTSGGGGSSAGSDDDSAIRRKREFIPDEKKDEGYWDKRRKNNEAAKRSREKRRANDMVLETRVLGLLEENARLRAELLALKFRFGLVKDPSYGAIHPISAPPSCPQPHGPRYYHHPHSDTPYPHNNTPSVNASHNHHHPYLHSHPPQQGGPYGVRGAGAGRDGSSLSEDSGFSTPGSSSVGSPVFFDDGQGEHGRPSPRRPEETGYEAHSCPPEADGGYHGRPDSGEGIKSLPHKLRFKAPGGGSGGGGDGDASVSVSPESRRGCPIATVGPNLQQRNQPRWDTRVEGNATWPREEARGGQEPSQPYTPSLGYSSPPQHNPTDSQYVAENGALKSQLSSLSHEVAQLKKLFSQQLLSKLV
ncbi:nuclear factor interleukin-3-regulated protein-like [Hypomesus transpacificus]|uniref:nuclear factor interleukin-3-regulated protein-like n=1 Tax=Hypomesus transpacificus TaxID=137520 RepID=UPI001F085E58|nr:nuclear factor interleukin-3-regulated protein-like [Hypomesus transpacificus]XP_046899879.1 nuclear factor interleukin-3-regulated protein-like [Hypomesus transpacificus]